VAERPALLHTLNARREQAAIDRLVSDAWQVGPDVSTDAVFELYREEVRRANAVLERTPLDSPPAWWPADEFGTWRLDTVGEIVSHVIAETATHAGQVDAARELIDRTQWIVLTG
jgi:uncharacterized damage-inducible protein DinB